MSFITHAPVPPYRAVARCGGHALGYGTFWEVVDAQDKIPWVSIEMRGPDTLLDQAWCEAVAEKLNAQPDIKEP
jgi:hypothetical protein